MGAKKQKVAFITGVTGQDGAHLAKYLLWNDYRVYGGYRKGGVNKLWRLNHLGILNQIELIDFQLNEAQLIIEILSNIRPDEIYHLAAESFVADSFKHPLVSIKGNVHGTVVLLDAIRMTTPNSKVFIASSSEIFGFSDGVDLLNESSSRKPLNPYAISKVTVDHFANLYREAYGLNCHVGILFNHEGPLRARQFVTRKISYNSARLKLIGGLPVELGSFSSFRDWGAAVDYVKAMHLMLENNTGDCVVATGVLHSVRELLYVAFAASGFTPIFEGEEQNEICIDKPSGQILAKVSDKYYRPFDTPSLCGDASKLKELTGWNVETTFENMITDMVHVDLARRKDGLIDV